MASSSTKLESPSHCRGSQGPGQTSGVVGPSSILTYDVKTRFFDKINLAYYFTDDLKGYIGHRYVGGRNAFALGGEAGFRLNGPAMASLFVEGRIGESDFHGVWGGLRFYFGRSDKGLMRRHREDDPYDWSSEPPGTLTNSGTTTPIPVTTTAPPPPPQNPNP